MKFGFAADWSMSIDDVVRSVKHAELLGFDSAWIADIPLRRDVYVALTACAVNTKSIRLGSAVTNPYTRHPAVTAAAFATLDEISKGRTAIGLGIGSKKNLFNPLGIERKNIPQVLREAVKLIREVLSAREASFSGQFFNLHQAKLSFPKRNVTPIYVAGRGANTLTVAGEVADGAMMNSVTTPEAIKLAMDAVDRGATSAGRDPSGVERVVYTRVSMAKDSRRAREAVRPLIPYRIWDDSFDTLRRLHYDETLVAKIKEAYGKEDIMTASALVTDQMLDDFAIAGTAKQCLKKVEMLNECGITQLIIVPVSRNYPALIRLLRDFSRTIMSPLNQRT